MIEDDRSVWHICCDVQSENSERVWWQFSPFRTDLWGLGLGFRRRVMRAASNDLGALDDVTGAVPREHAQIIKSKNVKKRK
jgi:hypothetical protein